MAVADEFEVIRRLPKVDVLIPRTCWHLRLFLQDGPRVTTFDSLIGAKLGILKLLQEPGNEDAQFKIRIIPVGLSGSTNKDVQTPTKIAS